MRTPSLPNADLLSAEARRVLLANRHLVGEAMAEYDAARTDDPNDRAMLGSPEAYLETFLRDRGLLGDLQPRVDAARVKLALWE